MTAHPTNSAAPQSKCTPTCCGILPPYLLRNVAEKSGGEAAKVAANTMKVERGMRQQREIRAAKRTDGRRSPTAADASAEPTKKDFIPDALRRRIPQATAVVAVAPRVRANARRSVYDAQHLDRLPGVLRRAEGSEPHADGDVNEAYDGLGATWKLYYDVYGRDSLDGDGLPLVASVHFEQGYDNAFWDGEQMVFGDGDGEIFRSFTDCPDVIGHELTHGFTQYTAGFVYVAQSGALNEHVSDVFGILMLQRGLRHTARKADWLIGKGLFTDSVQGVALRSMKAPGTAYDDPRLGKDPQPATMDGYVDLPHDDQNDNGGVHINSGIPNHAFYLAAVAVGGYAWSKVGKVWYDVMTEGGLPKDCEFVAFAEATVAAAEKRYGSGSKVAIAVHQAWVDVKVLVEASTAAPAEAPSWSEPAAPAEVPATPAPVSAPATSAPASAPTKKPKGPKAPKAAKVSKAPKAAKVPKASKASSEPRPKPKPRKTEPANSKPKPRTSESTKPRAKKSAGSVSGAEKAVPTKSKPPKAKAKKAKKGKKA